MRYAAETEQMERDGPPERPEDWDSLSDRIRKSRLKPKTLLQQQKGELFLFHLLYKNSLTRIGVLLKFMKVQNLKDLSPQKPF